MSSVEAPKKILTSVACFLCKAKVSSEEKIKVFGKSAVAIYSLILRGTEVDLSVFVGSNLASICCSRCYNRLLRYKFKFKFRDANASNNTSQSITSAPRAGIGAFPSASPSLPPTFTFGAVSPIAPVATFPTRGFLAPSGLLQNAFGGITSGFTGRLLTSMPQKQVDFLKPEWPKIQKQIARLPLDAY